MTDQRVGSMTDRGALGRLRQHATEIVSTLVTGIWLAALFTGQEWWLAALLFGYIVVVPLTAILFGTEQDRAEWVDGWGEDQASAEKSTDSASVSSSEQAETPLERLRRRYAEGELTEEQFERKLETLLETETLEDVEDRAKRRDETVRRTMESEPADER